MARVQQGHPMTITFLGTSGSWPTAECNVSATALKRGGEILLFDCGEGTQRQFQRSELSHMQVTKIFITHFHGDHTFGLPGYLKTMALNEREHPLDLFGPPGIVRLVEDLMRVAPIRNAFDIRIHEMRPGEPVRFDGYSVTAAEGIHGLRNFGYCVAEDPRPGRFDRPRAEALGVPAGPLFQRLQRGETVQTPDGTEVTPEQVLGPERAGRKVCISGDTRPAPALVALAQGADVLIHEATFLDEHQENAEEHGHSTAREAATVAKEAGVGVLWMHHFSPRYRGREGHLREAREVFEAAHAAADLQTIDVPLRD